MTAARFVSGAISLSTCTHLVPISGSKIVKPVMLRPGRTKVSTNPWATGSVTAVNTMGVVCVSCRIALTDGVLTAKTTSAWSPTNSFANFCICLTSPPAQRTMCSITRAPILIRRSRMVANSQPASGLLRGMAALCRGVRRKWCARCHPQSCRPRRFASGPAGNWAQGSEGIRQRNARFVDSIVAIFVNKTRTAPGTGLWKPRDWKPRSRLSRSRPVPETGPPAFERADIRQIAGYSSETWKHR